MGRTSKFLFPIPGRRNASNGQEPATPKSSSRSSSHSITSNLSKAQRILGTDSELNVGLSSGETPLSWGAYPSSRSSGISISISESTRSTRSTTETGSLSGSNFDQWGHERTRHLPEKASSTLLGQEYTRQPGAPTDASSISRRMRHEGSDSTLKSYYDRQKSPLSVSQQTSESSARDLALRKGYPQVVVGSPLLQVGSVDLYEQQFADSLESSQRSLSRDRSAKQPIELDRSMLFPNSRKKTVVQEKEPPVTRKKLSKRSSKESLQSHTSVRSSQALPKDRDTLEVHDRYDQLRPPAMSRIPESRVADHETRSGRDDRNVPCRPTLTSPTRLQTGSSEQRSKHRSAQRPDPAYLDPENSMNPSDHSLCKSLPPNMPSNVPWDTSSGTSISSRNTKTSRHTATSAFSSTDLKQSSVLSLSSDSEEDSTCEAEAVKSSAHAQHDRKRESHNKLPAPPAPQQTTTESHALNERKPSRRKGAAQAPPVISIPESSLPNPRISGSWSPPETSGHRESAQLPPPAERRERRSSRKPDHLLSDRSSTQSIQPTPPHSPSPVTFQGVERNDSVSGRYMAVTKQEEALLEALRQKRARMKESIIQEHESKSPPMAPSSTTKTSSVRTIRGPDRSSNKGHILLYLDPVDSSAKTRPLMAVSSPDSEYSDYASGEDNVTPRSSWVPPPPHAKPRRRDPAASKSGLGANLNVGGELRLSAVGADNGFQHSSRAGSRPSKYSPKAGESFVQDKRPGKGNDGEFFDEEDDD